MLVEMVSLSGVAVTDVSMTITPVRALLTVDMFKGRAMLQIDALL